MVAAVLHPHPLRRRSSPSMQLEEEERWRQEVDYKEVFLVAFLVC